MRPREAVERSSGNIVKWSAMGSPERREWPGLATVGRERFNRRVDRGCQTIPQFFLEFAVFATSGEQSLIRPLRHHFDDRFEIGRDQSGEIFKFGR